MTEMISYKVTELKLEIVNWYFEVSVCFILYYSAFGGGGVVLHYTCPDIFSRLKKYS